MSGSQTGKRKRGPKKFTKKQKGKGKVVQYGGRYAKPNGLGELKFHDIDVDDTVVAAGAVVQNAGSVNLIPQGVTEITRIGRKCTIVSINWRYEVTLPTLASGGGGTGDVLRVILYVDKQCNGATAANTDILESADYQSFNNLANASRFVKLMDKTYPMNYQAGAGDGTANDQSGYQIEGAFYKKCNIPLEFSAGTGALTEIRSNNIGVMVCSRDGAGGFASKLRLRFHDG